MADSFTQIRQIAEDYFGVALGDDLLAEFEVCEVAGGDWLFHQGEDGSSLYLMVRGRLQVFREGPEPGALQLLGEVVPGESVGETGLLSGGKRSAGIRAIRDSLLVRIDRELFERLSGSHPALVMKLVEVVQGPHVSEETTQISMALCQKLGKVPVHVKKEVNG